MGVQRHVQSRGPNLHVRAMVRRVDQQQDSGVFLMKYWLALEVDADDQHDADALAEGVADYAEALILTVEPAPPQGALIVGDSHEDEI